MSDDLLRQIDLLLDGELSEADTAAVYRLAAEDSTVADALALATMLHTQVGEQLKSEIRGQCSEANVQTHSLSLVRGRERANFKLAPIDLALAAALLISAAAVAIYLFALPDPQPVNRDPKSAGPPIATLIESTSAVVYEDGIANPGSEYPAGTYSIESGSAQLLLSSRVTVDLTGNTALTMHGDMDGTLSHGSARFNCPPGTEGFTVHLPDGSRVVDFGTAFEIDVDDGGVQTVGVSEGRVELRWADRIEPMSVGRYARYADGRWTFRHVDEVGVAERSDNVRILPFAPASVRDGVITSDTTLWVVTEQAGVALGQPREVAIRQPGRYAGHALPGGSLPADAIVDSYLIHFDGGDDIPTINATVTFDRPVLGVITNKDLAETDARFGDPHTRYADHDSRGVEIDDVIELSDDRRTLTLRLRSRAPDQLRVLVEAALVP